VVVEEVKFAAIMVATQVPSMMILYLCHYYVLVVVEVVVLDHLVLMVGQEVLEEQP